MKTTHYHNTTNQNKEFVDKQIAICETQEETILNIFKNEKKLSPSQAWEIYKRTTGKNTPITSIRRAISNLSNDECLHKTQLTILGIYGKPEHIYTIQHIQTELF